MNQKNSKPQMISRDAKANLARLMANENLTVEHRAVRTAYFDVENRVLTLPIWTDMTGDIYDTLVGHEIGHALETPAGIESIIKAIDSIDSGNRHGAKMFLNVIEDARIEKMVRRRYPGMRRSFSLGYKQLLDRDFFGTIGRDIKSYSLIDKINLYCKLGSAIIIDFSPKEMELVRMVENCETFSEVVNAAKELYEYCKLHKQEEINQDDEDMDPSDYDPYPDEDNFSFNDRSEHNEESTDMDHKDKSGDSSEKDDEQSTQEANSDELENSDDDSDDDSEFNEKDEDSSDSENDPSENFGASNENPTSETQENWEKMKEKLLSAEIRGYQYVNFPEIDGHSWIVPYKQVHYGCNSNSSNKDDNILGLSQVIEMENYLGNRGPDAAKRFALLNTFKSENSSVISFMVKEFEMRKAAEQYARQSISKTGVINTNKLHTYKYNDDIFRRITNVPNGKNHGLVMIIDWSGSMSSQMAGTIEQLLNLTIFCQRVQIPFEVFAFSDSYYPNPIPRKIVYNRTMYKQGDITIGEHFSLLQLLSSTMKPKEMNDALGNLLAVRDNFASKNYHIPLERFGLGGTPLDSAIICLPSIVNAFRSRNKLQIVNTIILTDGDSSESMTVNDKTFTYYGHYGNKVTIIRDTVTKAEYTVELGHKSNVSKILLQILQQRTNSNVLGYYLINGSDRYIKNQLYDKIELQFLDKTFDTLKNKKYVEISSWGYNTYYIIKANELRIENEELNIGKATTTKSIAKAFGKYTKKKQENRVMLSRFIEKISS